MTEPTVQPAIATHAEPVCTSFNGAVAANGRGARCLVDVGVEWNAADPLRVRVLLCQRGHPGSPARPVLWNLGRDLLADGLDGAAGHGDTTLFVDPRDTSRVELVLSLLGRPNAYSLAISLPRDALSRFLDRTLAVVPFGEETYDLDPADLAGGTR